MINEELATGVHHVMIPDTKPPVCVDCKHYYEKKREDKRTKNVYIKKYCKGINGAFNVVTGTYYEKAEVHFARHTICQGMLYEKK